MDQQIFYGEYKLALSFHDGVVAVTVFHKNPDIRAVDQTWQLVESRAFHPTEVLHVQTPP